MVKADVGLSQIDGLSIDFSMIQCGSKVRPVALFYTVKDPFGG